MVPMFTSLRLHISSGPPAAIQRGLSPHPRWRAAVDATLELTHQRADDVPLLLGFLIRLELPEILDRHYPAHPSTRGSPTDGSSPPGSPTSSPGPTTASPPSRTGPSD